MGPAECPVTSFDHHSTEYADKGVEIEADLRDRCPVSWSTNYGGFWVLATHDSITGALRDRDLCSAEKTYHEDGTIKGGHSVPGHDAFRLVPDEVDPPEWDGYRKILNPALAPPAVRALRPRIEAFTTEVINRIIERGEGDLVLDVSTPVTALTTLDILGLPLDDWRFYAEPIHNFGYTQGRDPSVKEAIAGIFKRLWEIVPEQRERPGDGLVGYLASARIDGEPLTDQVLVDMIYQLLVGGFDTTSALLANAFHYLDEHRDVHQRLIEDDDYLTTATEEFIRWVSPVVAMGRTAKTELALEGQQIASGDQLWLMFRSANRDANVFENPDEVDLTRFPNRHLGFGTGIHRCLGSNLARAVFQIVLRQTLERLPDYRVDHDNARRFPKRAVVNGWFSLPVTFTPGVEQESGLDIAPSVFA